MSYRKGAAIIILSADKKHILLGERRKPRGVWQIPQGGAEKGESMEETLQREFKEEIGIPMPPVVKRTFQFIRYSWPSELFPDSKHAGQEHIYFLLDGSSIDVESLEPTEEFVNFKWALLQDIVEQTIDWKREALAAALRELGLIK